MSWPAKKAFLREQLAGVERVFDVGCNAGEFDGIMPHLVDA